jgi:hypothetical protein
LGSAILGYVLRLRTTIFSAGFLSRIRFHEYEDRWAFIYRGDPVTYIFVDHEVIMASKLLRFLSRDVKQQNTFKNENDFCLMRMTFAHPRFWFVFRQN